MPDKEPLVINGEVITDESALGPPNIPPKPLTPTEIRRIGAMQQVEYRDLAMEQFCDEQRRVYRDLSEEQLIELLVERDRSLASEGRALADGRVQGKLLREFVRGVLNYADHAGLRRVGDATKTGKIEEILEALGAEPADLRQLRLHGTTLGPEVTKEERELQFNALADGTLKELQITTEKKDVKR